jgi:hypothetical protein
MNTIRKFLVAGAAVVGLAGLAGSALARGADTHVMTVQLPGGGVEQIRYSGDVAPEVVFGPPVDIGYWAWDDPFADLARISAEMDRAMSGMFREIEAMPMAPVNGWSEAALANLPPGTQSYSYVSTISGNGICGRSVQVTSEGPGHKPKVVSKSFGNCSTGGSAPSAIPDAAAPATPADTVQIRSAPAHRASPSGGLVQEVSWH